MHFGSLVRSDSRCSRACAHVTSVSCKMSSRKVLIVLALGLLIGLAVSQETNKEIDCTPTDGWRVVFSSRNDGGVPENVVFTTITGPRFAGNPTEEEKQAFFKNFADTLGREISVSIVVVALAMGNLVASSVARESPAIFPSNSPG